MVPETVFGTTPVSPVMVEIPVASFNAPYSKTGFTSRDRRSDRMIPDYRYGRVSGALTVEADHRRVEFDAMLEAVLMGTWTANVLNAGTVSRSFSAEGGYVDISEYHLYKGVTFNTFGLSIGLDGPIKTTFGALYREFTRAATEADSPTAAGTSPMFDSFTGSLTEGGSPLAIVSALSLNLDNGMQPQNVVFDDKAFSYVDGRSTLTGSMTAYFESNLLLAKFLGETASSLSIVLTDSGGGTHTILVPRIFYTGAEIPVTGDGPISITLPFQAVRDAATSTNLRITRSV
jgi:hypothetical protein